MFTLLLQRYKKKLEGNTSRKFGRKYFLNGNVNETTRIKINDMEAKKKIIKETTWRPNQLAKKISGT